MDTATRVQIPDKVDCISHRSSNLVKLWIQLFSIQLWVNSRADCDLKPFLGKSKKTLNSYLLNSCLKLTLCHILYERRSWYIYIYIRVPNNVSGHMLELSQIPINCWLSRLIILIYFEGLSYTILLFVCTSIWLFSFEDTLSKYHDHGRELWFFTLQLHTNCQGIII